MGEGEEVPPLCRCREQRFEVHVPHGQDERGAVRSLQPGLQYVFRKRRMGNKGNECRQSVKGDKGDKGDPGDPAGFGTAIATVENTSGDPGCQVVLSGPNTAKNMAFVFSGIVGRKGEKGNKGDTGGKGDTGAQGPLGPPGISSPVYASVSGTTGIPSVDATLSNTTLSLAFSGLKGEQGNPGSSQDYPFELVNNLTDGGTSKALTAEQGKHLYDNCLLLGTVVANNVSIGD